MGVVADNGRSFPEKQRQGRNKNLNFQRQHGHTFDIFNKKSPQSRRLLNYMKL
jgi:hypothetical protein